MMCSVTICLGRSDLSGCLCVTGRREFNGVCAVGVCVTKRNNSENRCISANNSRKPQKAHSKTESQPTSADQQHNNRSTRTRPQAASNGKKHPKRIRVAETNQHTAPAGLSLTSLQAHPSRLLSCTTLKSAPRSPLHGVRATIFSVELDAR